MTNSIWCANSVGFLQEKLFIDSIAMHEKNDLIQGHSSSIYLCMFESFKSFDKFLGWNLKVVWIKNCQIFACDVMISLIRLFIDQSYKKTFEVNVL